MVGSKLCCMLVRAKQYLLFLILFLTAATEDRLAGHICHRIKVTDGFLTVMCMAIPTTVYQMFYSSTFTTNLKDIFVKKFSDLVF